MKHLFNHLPKLAAVATIALGMSSCNRAQYATLPKTTPYHATYHGTVKPAPVSAQPEAAPQAPSVEVGNNAESKDALAKAPVASPVSGAPVAAKAPVVAAAPVAAKASTATPSPQKLNLTQRMALGAATKKLDKAASKLQLKQRTETASVNDTSALAKNIKLGIILLLVGVLLSIFGGIIGLLGLLFAIIGIVLIVLGLLDEV